jgi:hypothetical protein
MLIGAFPFLAEIHSSNNIPLKKRLITGKIPLIFVGIGLALSLIGVVIFPEFSPVVVPSSMAIPVCASGLFLSLIGLILVFVFYLCRQKKDKNRNTLISWLHGIFSIHRRKNPRHGHH